MSVDFVAISTLPVRRLTDLSFKKRYLSPGPERASISVSWYFSLAGSTR